MELGRGYKKTELGIIPEDWEIRQLGSLLKIRHGKEQKTVKCDYSQIPILGSGGEVGWATTALFKGPSVLIGRKGTINHPRYAAGPFWAIDTLFYTEIKPRLDAKFIFFKFWQIPWLNFNEASGVPSLNANTIENIQIALPTDIAEQQAIAEALSDADALITSLEKLIEKEFLFWEGVRRDIFEDKKINHTLNLSDVATLVTGKANVNQGNANGYFPFFTCAKQNTYSDTYSFDTTAIMVAGNGEVGNLNYYSGKFEAYQRTYVIKDFQIAPRYVWHCLSNSLRSHLGIGTIGSSIPYIKKEQLNSFQIPIIENLESNLMLLENLEQRRLPLLASYEKAKKIKSGMMQELLTGRTRLI